MDLEQALLASAAIPFIFPPVKIGGHTYVDGGVGNNTCTRQAAFFCRYLSDVTGQQFSPILCVVNDPPSFVIDQNAPKDLQHLMLRTVDLFHHELVQDTLLTWDRINKESQHLKSQREQLLEAIKTTKGMSDTHRDELTKKVEDVMSQTTSGTARLHLDLWEIRPNPALQVKDLLTFDPAISIELRKRGTSDFLETLLHKNVIDRPQRDAWLTELTCFEQTQEKT